MVSRVRSIGLRRAGLTVVAGGATGFLVTLLLTPVISRLYDPQAFGAFATVVAVASLFTGVSTLRLEVVSQGVADDAESTTLRTIAVWMALLWGIALSIVTVVLVVARVLSPVWCVLGAMVALGSFQLVGTATLTRTQAYSNLSTRNFVQGAGLGVVQTVLGLLDGRVLFLLAGFLLPRLVWLRDLPRGSHHLTGGRRAWRSVRVHAFTAGGSAAINSAAGQLPVLVAAFAYGNAQAGLLAMALRLLVSPLSLVGQAAAAASVGEVGLLLRNGDTRARRTLLSGMRDLFVLGAVPCLAAAVLGPTLVPWLLGEEWEDAGVLVALLSAGALAQFCASPVSQLLNVTQRSGVLLRWDVLRLCVIAAVLTVPAVAGGSFSLAIGAYAAAQVVLYGELARMVVRAVSRYRGSAGG